MYTHMNIDWEGPGGSCTEASKARKPGSIAVWMTRVEPQKERRRPMLATLGPPYFSIVSYSPIPRPPSPFHSWPSFFYTSPEIPPHCVHKYKRDTLHVHKIPRPLTCSVVPLWIDFVPWVLLTSRFIHPSRFFIHQSLSFIHSTLFFIRA